MSFVASLLSGWFVLARRFRFGGTFDGPEWPFQSGSLNGLFGNYHNCLMIRANQEGLYLSVFPLFRFGHPPLFVPWHEITVTRTQFLFFKRMRLALERKNP
jgi:hypothetical protein